MVKAVSMPDGDARLMRAYARGDKEAFETLYARYRGPLFRYFLRQCRSRAQAEELYQETWMRVIAARSGYRPEARFSTWLFRIAHNLLVDGIRKERGRPLDDLPEEIPDPACTDPQRLAAGQEKLRRYRLLLRALPSEQREVFLLKQESGLALEEIASLLSISFEAAKSRLRYAVGKLRAGLRDAEEPPETCADK